MHCNVESLVTSLVFCSNRELKLSNFFKNSKRSFLWASKSPLEAWNASLACCWKTSYIQAGSSWTTATFVVGVFLLLTKFRKRNQKYPRQEDIYTWILYGKWILLKELAHYMHTGSSAPSQFHQPTSFSSEAGNLSTLHLDLHSLLIVYGINISDKMIFVSSTV